MDIAPIGLIDLIAPQPTTMEVESESRIEGLLSREVLGSDFERFLDGLVGDAQNILAEFVNWESSGPTDPFNGLRDHLCGDTKFGFNVYLFGLFIQAKNPKKNGSFGQVIWSASTTLDIPKLWRNYSLSMLQKKKMDRKAHLFWEIPVIDAKVNELMDALSFSGKAKFKLIMTGDVKDAKTLYTVKNRNRKGTVNQN